MKHRIAKRVSAGTILLALMVAGSVAFAAWTATGTGDGYAKATTAQALTTVDVSASTTATLYPGATGDVLIRIDNPNPYAVQVTDVAGSGAITSDAGAGCDASTGVSFSDQSGLTLNVPAGSGIPHVIGSLVINLPYNDFEALERTVKARWGDLAAVIVEPCMGNAAAIMPAEGWLQHIRRLCDEHGIVMIIDEVKTGFRVHTGGAQAIFGVRADLATYAKSIANGFPLAAIAGTEEVMSVVGPGSVAQGGTYTGNVAGTAAADATLELLETQDILGSIARRGEQLMAGIARVLTDAGIPHAIMGFPQMFGFVVGVEKPPRDYRDCMNSDAHLYERIQLEAIERGVMAEIDFREPWFLCYEHSEADIDETLNVFADAVKAAKDRR